MLQQRDVRQVVTAENMPKAWLYQEQNRKVDKIDRPVVEIELPHWFYRFEEILEEMIS